MGECSKITKTRGDHEHRGRGWSKRICLKGISKWAEFMVSECVISDIGEEEVEKDTGMLRWGGRKVIKLTWMSDFEKR